MSSIWDTIKDAYNSTRVPSNTESPVVANPSESPMPVILSSGIGNMKLSKQGLAEIAGYEGCCTAPYKDSVGVWTFGVGHTRFDGAPIPETMPRGQDMSLEYCFELFQERIQRYEDGVNKAVHIAILQHQFDALMSFHYNTGAIGKATLVAKLNAGESNHEVAKAFLMWNKPKEIIRRRTNESKLFEFGIYSQDGECQVTTANIYGKEYGAHTIDVTQYIK